MWKKLCGNSVAKVSWTLVTSLKAHLAPRAGFEPATNRLTAERSTTELPGNGRKVGRRAILRNRAPRCQGNPVRDKRLPATGVAPAHSHHDALDAPGAGFQAPGGPSRGHAVPRNHGPDLQGIVGERSDRAGFADRFAVHEPLPSISLSLAERATPYAV